MFTVGLMMSNGCSDNTNAVAKREFHAEVIFLDWDVHTRYAYTSDNLRIAASHKTLLTKPSEVENLQSTLKGEFPLRAFHYLEDLNVRLIMEIRIDNKLSSYIVADKFYTCDINIGMCRETTEKFREQVRALFK